MALNFAEILSFPTTSKAFSAYESHPIVEPTQSPPRKSARLGDSTQAHSISPSKSKGKKREIDLRRVSKELIVVQEQPPTINLQAQAQQLLPQLSRSIAVLLDKGASKNSAPPLPASFEALSNGCFVLVNILHLGQDLFGKLRIEFEKATGLLAKELQYTPTDYLTWLGQFVASWQWFENRVNLIRSVFYPLDRACVAQGYQSLGIKELFLNIAKHQVFDHALITSNIAKGIATWAQAERQSSSAALAASHSDVKPMDFKMNFKHRPLIRNVIKALHSVSYYPSHFLDPFVEETGRFYTQEASRLRKKQDVAQGSDRALTALEYFVYVQRRFEEEAERTKDVLDENSWQPVIKQTERSLLCPEASFELAKDGLATALAQKDISAFAIMHQLYSRIDALDELRKAFQGEVQASVKTVVTDLTQEENMIPELVDLQTFLSHVLVEALHEQPLASMTEPGVTGTKDQDEQRSFTYAIHDAFESGFISRKKKPAEMIAKFIDMAMRKGQQGASEDQFWKELDGALGLYRYTQDKDVFRTFYERGLAKRLLLQKSASDDFEKMVVKRLREGYDPEFGKGDEMFKDLALSRELTDEFQSSQISSSEDSSIQDGLSVMVLQYSSWPFQKAEATKVVLPGEMAQGLTSFSAFYKLKQPNRKLDWNHALGTVTLVAQFDSGEKEISVSLYQALVLLLFNERPKWTGEDIKERTGLTPKNFVLTMQSLSLGKTRVLVKRPPGKNVLPDDEFLFNVKFEDKRHKIHISSIQQQETPEEHRETSRRVEQDRSYAIDAAVVRIMKGVKRLRFEELKTRTIEALKAHFVPNVADIKKQIESLVMREYLERDEKDKGLYCYVA